MKLGLSLAVVIFVIVTFLCVQRVVGPRALPIVDISPIDRLEQAGVVAFRGLQPQLETTPLWVFSEGLPGSAEIIAGFLKGLTVTRVPFMQWSHQLPFADIVKSLKAGAKVVLTLSDREMTGPSGKALKTQILKETGIEPAIVLLHSMSMVECSQGRIVFNPDDLQFASCSPLALRSRRFRRIYSSTGRFVALSGFGKQTYVLFVQ